jgi:hypothetical protein
MSINLLPIYNSQSFPTDNLTIEQANQLYYQKKSPNLIVNGDETVANETVYGTLTAGLINCTNAIVAGQNNSSHSLQGTLTVANTCQVGNGIISLSLLPRLASTIAPTDSKDLSTKKYTDDSIAAVLASNNTYTGTNTFNSNVTVANTFTASSSAISLTLLPRLQSVIEPSDDNDLSTKKYTDDSINAVVPISSDCVVMGVHTFSYYNSFGSNYYFVSPPPQNAFQFYINFPIASAGTYYAPSVSFSFKYYYTQATAISSGFISAVGSGSSQTYTSATLLSSSLITPINTSTIQSQFETDASFLVSLFGGSVITKSPIQTTTVWTNPSSTTSTTGSSVTISTKYGSTPVTYSVSPISFTYVNASKCRVDIKFPVINNTNIANDPRQSGWISSIGFSAKLDASAPNSNTLLTSLVTTPSNKTNSNSGGAYLTIS